MGLSDVLIHLKGDPSGFLGASKKVRGEVSAMGTDLRKLGGVWTAVTAGAFAIGAKKVFDAFAAQEDAVEGLRATLRATGRDAAGAADEIIQSAKALQDLTRHGDEAIIAGTEAVGILATQLSASELAQAQTALVGLADTFFKGDLQSAAQLLGKTLGSNVNALTRYGIQVDVSATQQEKLAQVMAQTGAMFDVSKDKAKTNLGVLIQARNAWGDLMESVGGVGVAALTSEGSMGDLTGEIQDATGFIDRNKATFVAWATVVVKAVEAVLAPFRALVRLVFNFGQNAGLGFTLIGQLLAGDWAGIKDTTAAINKNWADMGDALDDNKSAWEELLKAIEDAAKGGDTAASSAKKTTNALQEQAAAVRDLTAAQKEFLKTKPGTYAPAAPSKPTDWSLLPGFMRPRNGSIPVTTFRPTAQPGLYGGGARGEAAKGAWAEVKAFFKGLGDQASRLVDPKLIFSQFAMQGLSGISSWVFGQLGSMLFGGKDQQASNRERDRLLQDNTRWLQQVADGLQTFSSALLQEQGGVLSGVQQALQEWLHPTDMSLQTNGLQGLLEHFGATEDDLNRLAEEFHIVIRNSKGQLLYSGLEQLLQAMNSRWLDSLNSTFSGGWDLLQKQFQLLDITDPVEKFKQEIDFVSGLVGDDLAKTLQGLDPSNLDSFIKDFLARLKAGDQTILAELGKLSPTDFLNFLTSAESSLDGLSNSANKASEALLNAPKVLKAQLYRFNASMPGAGGGGRTVTTDTGTGSGTGGFTPKAFADAIKTAGVGGVTIEQMIVQANNPDELRQQIEKSAEWARRTGSGSRVALRTRS